MAAQHLAQCFDPSPTTTGKCGPTVNAYDDPSKCPVTTEASGVSSVVGVVLGLGIILTAVAIGIVWSYRKYRKNKNNAANMKQGEEGAMISPMERNMPGLVQNPVMASAAGGTIYAGVSEEQKHVGYACKKCSAKPIRGIRFSCSVCEYDVCQTCYLRFHQQHGDPTKLCHTFMKLALNFSPGDGSTSDLNYTSLKRVLDALSHPRVTSLHDFLPLGSFEWQAASRNVASLTAHVDLHLPNRITTLNKDEDTFEYNRVVDRVENYCKPVHGKMLRVTGIERVDNPVLEFLFCRRRVELHDPGAPTTELFHGTSAEAIMSIVRDGFRLPEQSKHGAMFGRGIYFATDSSKSERYCHGHNQLLLCEVAMGKQWKLLGSSRAASQLSGGNVLREYDSVHAPRDTKESKGVLHDEFIIYHPFQAIVRYIVTFDPQIMLMEPPIMQPLYEVEDCPFCNRKFGWFLWRYNCALCGLVCCDDCCKNITTLPEIRGYEGNKAICNSCNEERKKSRKIMSLVPKIKTAVTPGKPGAPAAAPTSPPPPAAAPTPATSAPPTPPMTAASPIATPASAV